MSGVITPARRAPGPGVPPRISGYWYGASALPGNNSDTASNANNMSLALCYVGPYYYDYLAVDVTISIDTGRFEVGLYSVLPSGLPGTRLLYKTYAQMSALVGTGAVPQRSKAALSTAFRAPSDYVWSVVWNELTVTCLGMGRVRNLNNGWADTGADDITTGNPIGWFTLNGATHGKTFATDSLDATFSDIGALSTWTANTANSLIHPYFRRA